MPGASVTWSSGNGAVATVNAEGLVTAVGNGSTQITARSGNATASITVTVAQSASRITITPESATLMSLGATVQLAARVLDRNGQAVSDAVVSWSSGDESVATVSAEGLVTAVMNGTAQITARSGSASFSVTVTVMLEESAITWQIAGNVPDDHLTMFREEMRHVRAYFAEEFGIKATGFNVLVGENFEALAPVYKDVVGRNLSDHIIPGWPVTYAWVTSSRHGGAVMTLMYGAESEAFSKLEHYIVHEYFHVLQGQLASGFEELPNGEKGWHTKSSIAPTWLTEGLASYADFKYTPTRPGRSRFLNGRYTPYEDLGWALVNGEFNSGDLVRSVSYANAVCAFGQHYFYALSFAASQFLTEEAEENAYVEFWGLLGIRATWQEAFEESFEMTFVEFAQAFEEWLLPRIPSKDQVTIQVLWPDMDANPQIRGEFLYLRMDDLVWEGGSRQPWSTGSKGYWESDLYLTITYPAGAIGSAAVSLWWSDDQISECLLGWYDDGKLTEHPEEATPIRFIGESYSLDWSLPGHPNTLPRLECIRRN